MITFRSKVHGTTQNRPKHILGIQNHGGGGKYLGLPEQFRRKKREMLRILLIGLKNVRLVGVQSFYH